MRLNTYFYFGRYKTNLKTELVAGITTFLASMYIIIVNPSILSECGMPFSGVLTATVLVSAFSSIFMGIYAHNPILVAPGMGLNAFFAYSVVNGMGVKWEVALGAVFWSGIIFLILSVFNIRTHIVKAIPSQIRSAVAAGIGLLITLIGLTDARFIVANKATILGFGEFNAITLTFLAGFFITAILTVKNMKGALIAGIVLTTLFSIPIGRLYGDATVVNGTQTLVTWQGLFAAPDFSLLFRMNLLDSLQWAVWPVIFALVFTDMFDSLSTFVGVSEAADLKDADGEPRNIKQSMIVDSIATTISGVFGSSPGTSYVESATGIEEGGRSGFTAVVAGLLFLPFIFLSPLLSVVPKIATAPALVLVGVFMMKPVIQINWSRFDDAIPAFLAMILIPLTSSITLGIIWGFITWTVMKLAAGKYREVTPTLIAIDILAILSMLV